MGDQVDAGDRGQPAEALGDPGNLEPWVQERRGLGALAGAGDGEHEDNPALPQGPTALKTPTNLLRLFLEVSYKSSGSVNRPAAIAVRSVNPSRGRVGSQPVSSPARRSRYRTVFGWMNRIRAVRSIEEPDAEVGLDRAEQGRARGRGERDVAACDELQPGDRDQR